MKDQVLLKSFFAAYFMMDYFLLLKNSKQARIFYEKGLKLQK